jgi:hypothetical protein
MPITELFPEREIAERVREMEAHIKSAEDVEIVWKFVEMIKDRRTRAFLQVVLRRYISTHRS